MIKFFFHLRNNSTTAFRLTAGRRLAANALLFALASMVGAGAARAATESLIFDFRGGHDGGLPMAGVIGDPAAEAVGIVPKGTLFGTTSESGKDGGGTLFKLTPPATSGSAWVQEVLHPFDSQPGSTDGFAADADLTVDVAGNLYGTTSKGGDYTSICGFGCGTVFELSPPAARGGKWTYLVLYRFKGGSKADVPSSKLTLDPYGDGVLYGTTSAGGDFAACPASGCGTVFSLTPPGVAGNATSSWVLSVLHAFHGGRDGANPAGSLAFDNSSQPHLFGTTIAGGVFGQGIVFELLPPNSIGNPTSHWSEKLIQTFKGTPSDGAEPLGLIIDSNDVLYGTTVAGGTGRGNDSGTVFEILPPSLSTTGSWEEVVLHSFLGASANDGDVPEAGLLLAGGDLYGATAGGISGNHSCNTSSGCGTVFKLAPTDNLKVWNEAVLVSFNQYTTGAVPLADLNLGASGSLYGTTDVGGKHSYGTVFQVTLP